jgi:hypothetical protein
MLLFGPLAAYVALKYIAYSLWCAVLTGFRGAPWWRGWLGLGFLRLIIGVAIGGGLTALGFHLGWAHEAPGPWLVMFLPIRWLEWSITAHFQAQTRPSVGTLLMGIDNKRRAWQAGGILVSFVTDFALVFALGWVRAMVC